MSKKQKKFHWQQLHRAMIKSVSETMEVHNLKYPTKREFEKAASIHGSDLETHKLSYPCRVKKGEMNTIFNVVRDFCKQVANRIKRGEKLIPNIVYTNRVRANKHGCKRVSNRHLAKGALSGIFLGQQADLADGKEYHFGEEIRFKPLKKRHGTDADFELLINPALIPAGVLPQGVEICAITHFEGLSHKERKTPQLPANLETLIDDKIRKKAVDKSANAEAKAGEESIQNAEHTDLSPSLPEQETLLGTLQETAKEVAKYQVKTQKLEKVPESKASQEEGCGGGAAEKTKNCAEGANQDVTPLPEILLNSQILGMPKVGTCRNRVRGKEQNNSGSKEHQAAESLVKMYTHYVAGQQIEAFADLLLQSYLDKIAPAQNSEYNPGEIQRARVSAKQLLEKCPPEKLEARVEAFLATIDRVQGWIQYSGSYVANPSKWLSPDYERNIVFAFNSYLMPWLERQKEFKARKPKTNADRNADKKQTDKELMTKSDWHNIAFQLKHAFLKFHPTDGRLRSANLNKWAFDLYDLVKKDHYSLDEILKVANWLVEHKGKRASFWRMQAANHGIRSASGFRKHFKQMLQQCGQDQVNALKYKEEPGKNRLPKYNLNPKQIPNTPYNPYAP